jgi:DNA repair exonuclease SbcCD ATPase subunit
MTDAQSNDTETLGKGTDSSSVAAGQYEGHSAEYWYRKYSGVTKKVSTLETEKSSLQLKLEELVSTHEDELANLKKQYSGASQKLTELEQHLASIAKEKDELLQTVTRNQAEKDARKLIADKYKELVTDFDMGDLKLPNEFESPEAYEAYLGRQYAKVTQGVRDQNFASGATPRPPTGERSKRTYTEIANEMYVLNPKRNPEDAKRYQELERELATLG